MKIILSLLLLTLSACSSTPIEEETFEWETSDTAIIVVDPCTELGEREEKPDC